jgi:hypothetical protein
MHLSVRPTVFHPRYFISSEGIGVYCKSMAPNIALKINFGHEFIVTQVFGSYLASGHAQWAKCQKKKVLVPPFFCRSSC